MASEYGIQQCSRLLEPLAKLGFNISKSKLKRCLRKLGFKWKRYRKSIKNKRDSTLFELFKEELKILSNMAKMDEIELLYFDGSGFQLNPNVPYGWLPKGQQITLPATRHKGWTVLGLLNINKETIEGTIYEGAATAECVVQFFDNLLPNIKKKTIVILDNASIHKANIVKQKQKEWANNNLFLQFIPAYSPELNLIEIFWKHMKHFWLKPQDYLSKETLYNAIINIFNNYGSKYTISFV